MDATLRASVRRRWTPQHLRRRPRLWLDGDAASFSGSNLSAWRSKGLDGSVGSVGGTPTRATLNGRNGVLFDASGENVSHTLGAWNTGRLFTFAIVKAQARGGAFAGLYHKGGVASTGTITFQPASDSTGSIYFVGNGFSSGGNPGIEGTTTPPVSQSAPTLVAAQLGMTNLYRVNGADLTSQLSTNSQAVLPNHASAAWVVGESWAGGSEVFLGELYQLVLLDYFPGPDDVARLEGWGAWLYGQQTQLASGHRYSGWFPSLGA